MKKIMLSVVIALMLLSTMFVSAASARTIGPTIFFGKDEIGGYVRITPNADGSITLLYMMRAGIGWCMTESHVHVGRSLDDFPTSPTRPDDFDFLVYGPDGLCTPRKSFTLHPDSVDPQWEYGDHIIMAIQVVATNQWLGLVDETGWTVRGGQTEDHFFNGSSWTNGLWLEIFPDDWD